jgi:TetR/AcrR family transcriptional regulator, tetracycline repressor protein
MAERNPLSRERIVETSFGLLEREGWEALSMRRLAQELDVWPMAVYRYFRDKDELVDALVDHAIHKMDVPSGDGAWRERLHAILGAARAALDGLPPELRTRLASMLFAPGAPGLATAGAETLASAGFAPDESARAWSTLGAFATGSVEIATEQADFDYGLDRLLDGLDVELAGRPEAAPTSAA